MSRIGKSPVPLPKGVKAAVAAGTLTVEGPLGKLEQKIHPAVSVAADASAITVTRSSDNRVARAVHGLTRALAANMAWATWPRCRRTSCNSAWASPTSSR
jgi:large subunit ribosomal protein L6